MEQKETKKPSGCLKIFLGASVLAFLGMVGAAIFSPESENDKATKAANELAQARQDTLTGNYYDCKRLLKAGLKDPDSFDEISHEANYVLQEEASNPYIQVIISYRAKNSFGGYVVGKQLYNYDRKNSMYETLDLTK